MPGRCDCGDPYCRQCGDPGAMARADALTAFSDKMEDLCRDEDEARIALRGAELAVQIFRAHRIRQEIRDLGSGRNPAKVLKRSPNDFPGDFSHESLFDAGNMGEI